MKCITLLLVGGCLATPAAAGPLTTEMSCAQARALVAREKAVVLYSTPTVFDRYVATAASCQVKEATLPAFVPTKDDKACPIGNRCIQPDSVPNDY